MSGLSHFLRGRVALAEGRPLEALACFEHAYSANPDEVFYASYYGLLIGQERGLARQALDLCQGALARSPHEPELYLNLAQVYRQQQQRQEALACIQTGLHLEPGHKGLLDLWENLGRRRRPVFASLPRGHFLNKHLGRWAVRLGFR